MKLLFQLTSRRTPSWANTNSLTDWLFFSPHVFKTVQPNLNRAHQNTIFGFTNWMCTPLYANLIIFSPEDQLVHRDHNSSPLREVQLATTLHLYMKSLHLYMKFQSTITREPKRFIRVASPNLVVPLRLPTYLTQRIKPTVVHSNELHQA